jgi:hypothetical protein
MEYLSRDAVLRLDRAAIDLLLSFQFPTTCLAIHLFSRELWIQSFTESASRSSLRIRSK